jgi:ATP-dependent DNA helicase DinG
LLQPSDAIAKALARAAEGLPNHEDRPQQLAMAKAVGHAIEQRRHLVVQAGTGTGKSLAYLVPALALGERVVVSTATKALQDQLAGRDLPQLSRSLGVRFTFAVLKGRSNYVCLQRVAELTGPDPGAEQMQLGQDASPPRSSLGALGREVLRLAAWASGKKATGDNKASVEELIFGDRAELAWEPSDAAWAQVSTGWRECPGAAQCPSGGECFAEAARRRASEADVVVVNTHLYATSLSIKEAELLPPHDLVVFDEAHELEDIVSAAFGFDLSQARLVALARSARALVANASLASDLEDGATLLGGVLRPHRDLALVRPIDEDVARALGAC